uniref:Peroxiredoxin-like 2A n=1 Tax=Cyprinus carpio TaxID=7962 RepID=A0A8C2DQA7_CYPCA
MLWSKRTSAQRFRTSEPTLTERSSSTRRSVTSKHTLSSTHIHHVSHTEAVVWCGQRAFYGPLQRWMGVSGVLRAGVWMSGWRAYQSGYWGNVRGEGFLLGAVYVIGPGPQGILLEHREMEFGDKVNKSDVIQAVEQIKTDIKKA